MARDVERIVGTLGGHPKGRQECRKMSRKEMGMMLGDVGERGVDIRGALRRRQGTSLSTCLATDQNKIKRTLSHGAYTIRVLLSFCMHNM